MSQTYIVRYSNDGTDEGTHTYGPFDTPDEAQKFILGNDPAKIGYLTADMQIVDSTNGLDLESPDSIQKPEAGGAAQKLAANEQVPGESQPQ